MSVNTPEGLECSLTSESIDQAIDSLVDAIEAPESALSPFIELVYGMAHQLDETAQEATQARKSARTNEEKLKEHQEESAKERAQIKQRVTSLENEQEEGGSPDSNDETPTPEAGDTALHKPETPLEQVCAFDEETADRELTANQSRARFIARDIADYSDKVPAGFSLSSSDIATVLRAGTDCRGRTQTVARVMDFLSDLGRDGVEIVERRGTKRVVFSAESARRLEQIASDPSATDNTVVMRAGT